MKPNEKLKFLREKKGMTQCELSKLLSISEKAISHYETGKRIPPSDILFKICNFFDINPEEFINPSPYDSILKNFIFLNEQPQFIAITESNKLHTIYTFRNDKNKKYPLNINICKEGNGPKGVVHFVTKKKEFLFSNDGEYTSILDAPEWFLNLYIKAVDVYEEWYQNRENKKRKTVDSLIEEFFVRFHRNKGDFMKTKLHFHMENNLRASTPELLHKIVHFLEQKGYSLYEQTDTNGDWVAQFRYSKEDYLEELVQLQKRENYLLQLIQKNEIH